MVTIPKLIEPLQIALGIGHPFGWVQGSAVVRSGARSRGSPQEEPGSAGLCTQIRRLPTDLSTQSVDKQWLTESIIDRSGEGCCGLNHNG
jgi:hypothetical protein